MAAEIRIGASSWTSDAWWGRIYPRDLPLGERLRWYARLYDCVEVDATYYSLPSRRMVEGWYDRTPRSFLFTIKLLRDLLDPKKPVDRDKLATFLANTRALKEKLAAILLQFPPWVKPGFAGRFVRELLDSLEPGVRYSLELRDSGWFRGEQGERLFAELRDRSVALTWSSLRYVEIPPELTADWVYLRFIGDHETVPAAQHGELRIDQRVETERWAERVTIAADRVRQILAFFNNHFAGFAPGSINMFRELLGLPKVDYGELLYTPTPTTAVCGSRRLEEFDRSES